MADEPPRLPARAEDVLGAFPIPDRDWEASALAIDQKISATPIGSTDAALLEAPFPGDETDAAPVSAVEPLAAPASTSQPLREAASRPPSRPSSPGSAPASGKSLSELARTVAQKQARRDSSDIYKQSLTVAAAARAQSEVVIERVKGARLHNERPEPPRPPPAPSSAARRGSLTPFLAGAAVALAAAAFILVLRSRDSEPAPVAVAVAPAPQRAEPNLPAEAPRAVEPAPSAVAAAPPAPVTTPEALPLAPAPAKPVAAEKPAAAGGRALAGGAAAAAPRVAPDAVKLEDSMASAAGSAAPVAPPAASALRPASGSPGGLPDRPATGAVLAALGKVMGPARACVAGASAPVLTTVVFSADGAVSQVIVRGPAAATPAAACIQTALSQARVEPFAAATYSTSISVRP